MQSDAEAVRSAEDCVLAAAEWHMVEYDGLDDLYDEGWFDPLDQPEWLDGEPYDDFPEW